MTDIAKPWYKELWFWLLISPMLTLIVTIPMMITTAFKGADDRVIDDYYKEGRMINNRFDAQRIAFALNLKGELVFDWLSGELWFTANQALPDEILTLLFSHPAKKKFDFSLVLRRVDDFRYRVDLPSMQRSHWYLSLEGLHDDAVWRITADAELDATDTVLMVAVEH